MISIFSMFCFILKSDSAFCLCYLLFFLLPLSLQRGGLGKASNVYVWIRVENIVKGIEAMTSLFKAVVENEILQLNVIPKLSLKYTPGNFVNLAGF